MFLFWILQQLSILSNMNCDWNLLNNHLPCNRRFGSTNITDQETERRYCNVICEDERLYSPRQGPDGTDTRAREFMFGWDDG